MNPAADILSSLNPAQREAVGVVEGPVLILAGPGSGKTRVITHRIAYLIRVCGISPYRILAVTFTNKAAREMKERVSRLLGEVVDNLTLGTFHAISSRILRQESSHIGLDKNFVIYDETDQLNLIKRSLEELGLDPKIYTPKAVKSAISAAKVRLIGPGEYHSQNYFEEVVRRVYECYQGKLYESKALDFDDLLMKAVLLFRHRPEVLKKYQKRFLHILVDEFQDTNLAQYVLAKQIGGKHHNVCVVGDPDQSIYSWRHADLRNILSFEKDFPEAKLIFLEQSYRSTKTILEAASQLISVSQHFKEKRLFTENEVGVPLELVQNYNEQEEAQFVTSEVERLLRNEYHFYDLAVMYRTNAQSRALEEAFLRYGLPYKLVGATKFYERAEVKDTVSYLRLLHNPFDSASLFRIINTPPRGIGERTLKELMNFAQSRELSPYEALKAISEDKSGLPSRSVQVLGRFYTLLEELLAGSQETDLVTLLDLLLEKTGYKNYILERNDGEERWNNILELRSLASEYNDLKTEEALAGLLERASLVSEVDSLDEKVDAVTLITLHQAKGLEFPVVFIVGLNEGLLPHFKASDPEGLEEERRLCYVGMTRAKEKLYLAHTYRRGFPGGGGPTQSSRFLENIPQHLARGGRVSGKVLEPSCPTKLEVGDRVSHAKFGEGVVVECLAARGDYEVTVDFREAGIKKLLLSLAPMEKA